VFSVSNEPKAILFKKIVQKQILEQKNFQDFPILIKRPMNMAEHSVF